MARNCKEARSDGTGKGDWWMRSHGAAGAPHDTPGGQPTIQMDGQAQIHKVTVNKGEAPPAETITSTPPAVSPKGKVVLCGVMLDALPDTGAQVSCISKAGLDLVKATTLGEVTYRADGKNTTKQLYGAGGELIGNGKVWEGAQVLVPISKICISTDLYVINSSVPKILLSKLLLKEMDIPLPEDYLWSRRQEGSKPWFGQQGTKASMVSSSEAFRCCNSKQESRQLVNNCRRRKSAVGMEQSVYDDESLIIEEIMEFRIVTSNGVSTLEFLIKWKSIDEPTWETEEAVVDEDPTFVFEAVSEWAGQRRRRRGDRDVLKAFLMREFNSHSD